MSFENYDQKIENLITEYKQLTEKKCYEIVTINESPDILDDKISGIPYLPIGEQYPKDSEGNPMSLLTQINLKKHFSENFPNKGILEFFWKKEIEDTLEYEIRYYDENLEYQKDLPLIKDHGDLAEKPYKIEFKKIKEYMPISDINFNDVFCSLYKKYFNKDVKFYNEIDGINDIFNKLNNFLNQPTGSIGGYTYMIEDPIEDAEMKECLFKIDSSLGDICIGNAGNINVIIHVDDLKNAKFEKAEVYWDCG